MFFPFTKEIEYHEVDGAFRVKPGVFFRLLQEAAIRHSRAVGYDTRHLNAAGFTWILARYGVDIRRYPEYGETAQFVTWSRGVDGFRAFRDFRVLVDGIPVATAATLWVYLDLASKRVRRIPPAVAERYTTETEHAVDWNIQAWNYPTALPAGSGCELSTRAGDLDSNGHVNNSVYVEYVETALARRLQRPVSFQALRLQFEREIDPAATAVGVTLDEAPEGWHFLLADPADPTRRYARGACSLVP